MLESKCPFCGYKEELLENSSYVQLYHTSYTQDVRCSGCDGAFAVEVGYSLDFWVEKNIPIEAPEKPPAFKDKFTKPLFELMD